MPLFNAELTNYRLLTSTSADSGITINIYQDAVEPKKVNVVIISIAGDIYQIERCISFKEALAIQADQLCADFDHLFD